MSPHADARTFLRELYSGVGAGFIEIRPLLDSSDPLKGHEEGAVAEARARRWFPWPRGLDACAKYCAAISGRSLHVYYGVALRRRDGGGTKKDVGCATAVFADVDFKDVPRERAHAALASFRFRPSVCVRSGNGVHVYWFLREPVFESGFAELERLNRAILVSLGAQVGPQNVDRILRVPGTANVKARYPDPKPIAEVSWWRPDLRYSFPEMAAAFPAPVPRGPERVHAPRPPSPPAELPDDALGKLARVLSDIWVVGVRHYLALHLGGACAHAGLDRGSAERLVELACVAAADEELPDRLEAVASSYRKHEAGAPVAGFPALLEFMCRSFPQALLGKGAAAVEILRGNVAALRGAMAPAGGGADGFP